MGAVPVVDQLVGVDMIFCYIRILAGKVRERLLKYWKRFWDSEGI